MIKPKYTTFVPRWMRSRTDFDVILDETPATGSFAEVGMRKSRRSALPSLETLEGQITALDISESKLQLSMDGKRTRVTGHFSSAFLPSLLKSLGLRARLQGRVSYRNNTPVSIQVENAELMSEDS